MTPDELAASHLQSDALERCKVAAKILRGDCRTDLQGPFDMLLADPPLCGLRLHVFRISLMSELAAIDANSPRKAADEI